MLELIKYRIKLAQLKKEQKTISKDYRDLLEADTTGNNGELDHIAHKEKNIYYYISYVQTEYYKSICDKFALPMPDVNDINYIKHDFDDEEGPINLLSVKGMHRTIALIKEERRSNREVIGFWFTIITGLIGMLIGLISVIKI